MPNPWDVGFGAPARRRRLRGARDDERRVRLVARAAGPDRHPRGARRPRRRDDRRRRRCRSTSTASAASPTSSAASPRPSALLARRRRGRLFDRGLGPGHRRDRRRRAWRPSGWPRPPRPRTASRSRWCSRHAPRTTSTASTTSTTRSPAARLPRCRRRLPLRARPAPTSTRSAVSSRRSARRSTCSRCPAGPDRGRAGGGRRAARLDRRGAGRRRLWGAAGRRERAADGGNVVIRRTQRPADGARARLRVALAVVVHDLDVVAV